MKSKEELEKEMNDKNRLKLEADNGICTLITYNLENFAFRYLETTDYKNIKCEVKGTDFQVCSVENDILKALKWKNPLLKSKMIDLAKSYPGTQSKEIKIKMLIGTSILSSKSVKCYAFINWDFPNFDDQDKGLALQEIYEYDDPLDLRNHHAAVLERVCEIF